MKKQLYVLLLLLAGSLCARAQNNTVCPMDMRVTMGPVNGNTRTVTLQAKPACKYYCILLQAAQPSPFNSSKTGTVPASGTITETFEMPAATCGKISFEMKCGNNPGTTCNEYECLDTKGIFLNCTPSACPGVVEIYADQPPACNTIVNGNHEIQFSAFVTNPENVWGYTWNFGDGQQIDTQEPNASHTYHCPDATPYLVTLTAVCKTRYGTSYVTKPIELKTCDCPAGANDQVSFEQKTAKTGCSAFFEAVLTGPCPGGFSRAVWDFGDGSIPQPQPTAADGRYTMNHVYECPGEYTVTMRFEGLSADAGLCRLTKKITVTDCGSCEPGDPADPAEPAEPGTGTGGNGNDDFCFSCEFCGGNWVCCLLAGLFMLLIILTGILLIMALCETGTATNWAVFMASLFALISVAVLWMTLCEVNLCRFLGSTTLAGWIGWGFVCGSTLLSPCNRWICQMVPIAGNFSMQRLLIAQILLTILSLTICGTGL